MIPGLTYISNWLTETEEQKIIEEVEKSEWESSLKRRVQQYGPRYNYANKKLITENIKEIPYWLNLENHKLFFERMPEQIIVNEYQPNQGITKHIDNPIFGPVVASVSLLSDAVMLLGQYNKEELSFLLERRSCLYLTGEARNKYYHCIPPVKERRISLTFRTIL